MRETKRKSRERDENMNKREEAEDGALLMFPPGHGKITGVVIVIV